MQAEEKEPAEPVTLERVRLARGSYEYKSARYFLWPHTGFVHGCWLLAVGVAAGMTSHARGFVALEVYAWQRGGFTYEDEYKQQ